jgi:hypothetical protein
MVESVLHTLGFCGESHPNLLGITPFISYIIENNSVCLYAFNTWQKIKL